MRHRTTALAALVMLVAACSGDTTTETTAPEIVIERPTINTEAPPPVPTTPQEEPETVTSEPESAATETETPPAETVVCPEGTIPIDEGGCLHVPDETPQGEETAAEPEVTVEETPVEEPDATVEETLTDATEEPVEEPVGDSDYEQTGPYPWEISTLRTHSPDEVVWWYPDLMKDAFELIDPNSVGADDWEVFSNTSDDFTPAHGHYVFYTGPEVTNMRRAWRVAAEEDFWHSVGWFYYPVRYDASFMDEETVRIVGTWPLGETREVLVGRDGRLRQDIPNEDYPPPPPLAPLPPFAEPDYPEYAQTLGRNCPSVEALWFEGKPVTDPCTLIALQNAVQYAMGAATVDQSEAAIRDGWGAREAIQLRQELRDANPFLAYRLDPANPGHRVVELRSIRWTGKFAGASRIYVEWRSYSNPMASTPEFQQFLRDEIQRLVESGAELDEKWLGEELPEDTGGFWDSALMVRTADGTWRMSYTTWCYRMSVKSFAGVSGKPVQCPDDPNPLWADAITDTAIFFPPNKVYYWKGQTPAQLDYYGQPPS